MTDFNKWQRKAINEFASLMRSWDKEEIKTVIGELQSEFDVDAAVSEDNKQGESK